KEKFKLFLIIFIFSLYGIRTILRNYDWKDPEKFYLKSINYSFYPSLLYGNLCYHYLRNGEYEKSYSISKKAILYGLKNEPILYIYGVSSMNIGKYDEAEVIFKEILKLNPKNYEALTELGYLYFIKGEYEKGIKLLNESLKINENYPKTYYIFVEIYRVKKERENYLNKIEELIKITPYDFYPYYLKGLAFKEKGDYLKANENFNKAYNILKNKNDFYSIFNCGILMKEMGRVNEALELFYKLLKLKPENIEILNEIGICYAMKGDKEKARKIWENILFINPKYYPAKENLRRLGN
ncbi:MAG: tetratricopeptide repeat protein, partial [Candidatus Omnitrophica bacterium]|nr:tetratricopeptide repeat protein [Candidatus Omnitrophota bacterium]